MNSFYPIFPALIAVASFALAEPVGICLHSYSPLAPPDKIECFEYIKFEKIGDGLRFFLYPNGTTIVPKIRYRGIIEYAVGLRPGDPKFDEALALYVNTATESPLTRRFLNERVKAMRDLAVGHQSIKQQDGSAAKASLAGVSYSAPKFKALRDGLLTISHQGGAASISIDKIARVEWEAFQKIDLGASKIKVISIGDNQFWDPRFAGLTLDGVKIEHIKGTSTLDLNSMSEADNKTLASLSDGSWRLAKPGFLGASNDGETYAELLCYDGKVHKKVKLSDRINDEISISTSQGIRKLPIKDASELPGKSKADQTRVADWVDELAEQKFKSAKSTTKSRLVEFEPADELLVTNVSAKILQVLNEGVLASEFVGTLHTGNNLVELTTSTSITHPVTGKILTKILHQTEERDPVIEPVRDDLCFILGNSKMLTERQTVNISKMILEGKYEYVDVRGAKRTVRKYSVQ